MNECGTILGTLQLNSTIHVTAGLKACYVVEDDNDDDNDGRDDNNDDNVDDEQRWPFQMNQSELEANTSSHDRF